MLPFYIPPLLLNYDVFSVGSALALIMPAVCATVMIQNRRALLSEQTNRSTSSQ